MNDFDNNDNDTSLEYLEEMESRLYESIARRVVTTMITELQKIVKEDIIDKQVEYKIDMNFLAANMGSFIAGWAEAMEKAMSLPADSITSGFIEGLMAKYISSESVITGLSAAKNFLDLEKKK